MFKWYTVILRAMSKDNKEQKADMIKAAADTCKAIADNLRQQGYDIDIEITITNKNTKQQRTIAV